MLWFRACEVAMFWGNVCHLASKNPGKVCLYVFTIRWVLHWVFLFSGLTFDCTGCFTSLVIQAGVSLLYLLAVDLVPLINSNLSSLHSLILLLPNLMLSLFKAHKSRSSQLKKLTNFGTIVAPHSDITCWSVISVIHLAKAIALSTILY